MSVTSGAQASATARRVAVRRAAHQLLDAPRVFDDPLALRIIGPDAEADLRADPRPHLDPASRRLRAFLAARSRFAEDALAAAVARGVGQYVILGAGLDTFAYRAGAPALRVFEVDHPSTQAWKRARLAQAGIAIPPSLTFAPVDFETEPLADGLVRAGVDAAAPAFFSWLGVTPYLTRAAVLRTLAAVGAGPAPSEIVLDFTVPPETLSPPQRRAFEALAARVAAAGEPFVTFFEPADLSRELEGLGFGAVEVVDPDALNHRYFSGRGDGLRVGGAGRLLHARSGRRACAG